MNRFNHEHWMLYLIYCSYPEGCEWNDPTEEDKGIIRSLSRQGVVHESSKWSEGAHRFVPLLCFTEMGAKTFIREDGGFLFEKEFLGKALIDGVSR